MNKKGKGDDREIFINKLQKLIPNIKFDLYGMKNNQPIWADNFINRLSQSKMGLNLSQGKPVKYYSSDRIAQLIGNGIATFIDKKTQLNDLLTLNGAIFYNSIDDLSIKLNKLIKNDKLRNKIAKKSRLIYHKKFNSLKVSEFILCKTFNIKKKFDWK